MGQLKLRSAFIALMLLFTLAACKKDNAEPTTEKMIVGKWFVTGIDKEAPSEALSECDNKTFLQFKNDGSLYGETHYMENGECTYNATGGSYSITTDHKYIVV